MLSIQLPPLEVFNATLLHELCLKNFSNLLLFTSHNRACYTSWIHAWSLPQTVASKFILEICHNAFLLNFCFKWPANHFHTFHLSSNIISKIRLEITHKLIPPYLIAAQIIPYSNYAWNVSPLKLCLICPTNYSPKSCLKCPINCIPQSHAWYLPNFFPLNLCLKCLTNDIP